MSSTVIHVLAYHDAPKAIDWLVEAFGFERRLVIDAGPRKVAHAELTYGPGMLMIDSVGDDAAPLDADQNRPGGVYVIVDDVDAHAARAVAAGARIVDEPTDQPHGGRAYSCADIEGYVWGFGSYDPWKV
ncbi:VOC family protein [Micromonospora sp. DT48]|uniref:VOC family protein n=1 Tax=unclassified Micromonospora TaxID=2617518 RepID=UPI0012BBDE51|nr:VOC family protein [Micromonospora sp. CP22]MTK01511.1 glyoxalase [Micromonospora sp. CP22]